MDFQDVQLNYAEELYNEWSNDLTHYRSTSLLPDKFKIDLRDFMMLTDSRTVTYNYGLRWSRQHAGLVSQPENQAATS